MTKSHAHRQKRYRNRQRNGTIVMPIELHEHRCWRMLRNIGLIPHDCDDRETIRLGMEKFIKMVTGHLPSA